jgi:uncharacterized protein YdaU (DUF1376 family)
MKVAYLPLYVRDWRSDPKVALLSWTERALYLDLLMLSWELGPLPADLPAILRAIGWDLDPTEGCAVVGRVLARFWKKAKAGWTNPRLELERERTEAMLDARSERGRRGAAGRWGKAQASSTDASSIAQASARQCVTNAKSMARAPEPEPSEDCSGLPSASESFPSGNPPPPSGSAAAPPPVVPGEEKPKPEKKPRKRVDVPEWTGELPAVLQRAPFPEKWARWLVYRRTEQKARAKVTQIAGDEQLAYLASLGFEGACDALSTAMSNGWQGVFQPRGKPSNGHGGGANGAPRQSVGTVGRPSWMQRTSSRPQPVPSETKA